MAGKKPGHDDLNSGREKTLILWLGRHRAGGVDA